MTVVASEPIAASVAKSLLFLGFHPDNLKLQLTWGAASLVNVLAAFALKSFNIGAPDRWVIENTREIRSAMSLQVLAPAVLEKVSSLSTFEVS
jgi:hypothetical protein